MYEVEYISCLVCGKDSPRWLGVRGNREHAGVNFSAQNDDVHMVTNVVQCRHCQFIYTNPLILGVGATTQDGGYGHAETYESTTSVSPKILFNTILKKIEKWRKPPGRLLDIGCGKGEFLNVVRDKGWSVFGVEQSASMSEYATKSLGLEVFCGTLKDAKWLVGFFDVITLNMVLEHVHDPNSLFRDIVQLLKDKGLLFIEVPNMDSFMLTCASWYFRFRGLDWSPLLSPLHYPFHCYGYNKRSLTQLASLHGLKPKETIITDTRFRGFRLEGNHRHFEKWARDAANRFSYWIGRGDVLMMFFEKTG